MLREYVTSYNAARPHRSLGLAPPLPVEGRLTGRIRVRPVPGGLHHVYDRAA